MTARTPSYRLHKSTGLAVVTVGGKDLYLGRHGSAESRAEYDRVISEWLASGRRLVNAGPGACPDGPTVNELLMAYLDFAAGYYRKGGRPTKELSNICLAIRPLRQLYGHTLATKFGPLGLKANTVEIGASHSLLLPWVYS